MSPYRLATVHREISYPSPGSHNLTHSARGVVPIMPLPPVVGHLTGPVQSDGPVLLILMITIPWADRYLVLL